MASSKISIVGVLAALLLLAHLRFGQLLHIRINLAAHKVVLIVLPAILSDVYPEQSPGLRPSWSSIVQTL